MGNGHVDCRFVRSTSTIDKCLEMALKQVSKQEWAGGTWAGIEGAKAEGLVDKKGERRNCSLEKGICLWVI